MTGTAHADQSTLDYGISSGRQWDTTSKVPDFTEMCGSVNDGPQRYIVRAAFAALGKWVVDGTPPPTSPAIEVTGGSAITRDARGNALGGIRLPAVDAPIESLSGEYEPGKSVICSLFGARAPFDAATLQQLYPTHDDYVAKVKGSADAAVKAGFLLPPDAQEIDQQAQSAKIPS
jgi:Alpha/beta hydrolase domain